MPKCQHCGRQYFKVLAFVIEENKYKVQMDEAGKMLDWSVSEVVESSEKEAYFRCPYCLYVLATWKKSITGDMIEDFTTVLLRLLTKED